MFKWNNLIGQIIYNKFYICCLFHCIITLIVSSSLSSQHVVPLDPLYIKVYQQLICWLKLLVFSAVFIISDLYIWCRIYISLAGFIYLMLDLYIPSRIYISGVVFIKSVAVFINLQLAIKHCDFETNGSP